MPGEIVTFFHHHTEMSTQSPKQRRNNTYIKTVIFLAHLRCRPTAGSRVVLITPPQGIYTYCPRFRKKLRFSVVTHGTDGTGLRAIFTAVAHSACDTCRLNHPQATRFSPEGNHHRLGSLYYKPTFNNNKKIYHELNEKICTL